MGARLESLREQAERISDAQEVAQTTLERAQDTLGRAQHLMSLAQNRFSRCQNPDERRLAERDVAQAQAMLMAAQQEVNEANGQLRSIEAERSAAQRATQSYLDSAQEAYGKLGAAAQAGPYGAGILGDAQDGLLQDLIQGQQVMQQLGGTWHAVGFGGLPNTLAGGVSLSTLGGTAILSGGSDWDSPQDPQKVYTLGGTGRRSQDTSGFVTPDEESAVHPDSPMATQPISPKVDDPGTKTGMITPGVSGALAQAVAPQTDSALEGGMNIYAHRDIKATWEHIESNYDRQSTEFQECVWRTLEHAEGYHEKLEARRTEAMERARAISHEVAQLSLLQETENLSKSSIERMNELNTTYRQAAEELHAINNEMCDIEGVLMQLRAAADPAQRTAFVAFGGADYEHAYDRFVTDQQGQALGEFGGHCGLNEVCNMTNQQRGYSIGPAEMIKTACNHKDDDGNPKPLCQYKHDSDNPRRYFSTNGGTTWDDRKELLSSYGISAKRIKRGALGGTKGMTPDDIYGYLLRGESVGLTVKAQDLAQEALSQRTKWEKDSEGYFHSPRYSNHCVSVAGVSLDAKGHVSCIWINDTSGVTNCNRIPISVKKYWKMLRHTKDFGVEIGRWVGNSGR